LIGMNGTPSVDAPNAPIKGSLELEYLPVSPSADGYDQ